MATYWCAILVEVYISNWFEWQVAAHTTDQLTPIIPSGLVLLVTMSSDWEEWLSASQYVMYQLVGTCYHRHRFLRAIQDCVVPYVDIILHRGRFWAISTALGREGCDVLGLVGRCSATRCVVVLVVFSSPPEGRLTGSFSYAQCAQTE